MLSRVHDMRGINSGQFIISQTSGHTTVSYKVVSVSLRTYSLMLLASAVIWPPIMYLMRPKVSNEGRLMCALGHLPGKTS